MGVAGLGSGSGGGKIEFELKMEKVPFQMEFFVA
jgi:hypothetical protein